MCKILTISIPIPEDGKYNLQLAVVRQPDTQEPDQPGHIIRHTLPIDPDQLHDESLIRVVTRENESLKSQLAALLKTHEPSKEIPKSQKAAEPAEYLPW